MKLFVLFSHSCLKFCTGGSSERIQKRELYVIYIYITVTNLPLDALTANFCKKKTLIDLLVSGSLRIFIFHCICICFGNSNAKNPST
ncbi:hypothetical protein AMTRI_Chr07g27080 [Amborella trichopoda]